MLQQAAVEPFAQAWRKEAGLEFGWSQAAQNIAFAGLFGGALDAAGRTIGRVARGKPLAGTPDVRQPGAEPAPEGLAEPPRMPPPGEALDATLEAAARRLPEESPVRRAAEGDGPATIAIGEKLGSLSDDPDGVRGALAQLRHETLQEASIAEALQAADVEDRLAAHIRHVAEPDANPPAGAPLVHAPSDAGASSGAAIADAVDPAVVTALREGELAPLEAAALIRERPELAGEIPPTTATAQAIHALSRLSEPGFARVVDGTVPADWAAIVADAAPPARHADLLERLVRAAPRDATEARRVIAEMLQAPTDAATAAHLLGASDAGATALGGQPKARLRSPEFDEPVGDGAKLQADSLQPMGERALEAVTGSEPAQAWQQKLVDDLEAATGDADAGALVQACKLF
jgi:hypothetical protein